MSKYVKQVAVRATYMRGGTSKGVFFTPEDMPEATRVPGAARDALAACGDPTGRPNPTEAEQQSLQSLRRGVYAKVPLTAGTHLDPGHIFLAMPAASGQLTANDLGRYVDFQVLEAIPGLGPVRALITSPLPFGIAGDSPPPPPPHTRSC